MFIETKRCGGIRFLRIARIQLSLSIAAPRYTMGEAIDSLRRRGIVADYDGNEIFDCVSGATIGFLRRGKIRVSQIAEYRRDLGEAIRYHERLHAAFASPKLSPESYPTPKSWAKISELFVKMENDPSTYASAAKMAATSDPRDFGAMMPADSAAPLGEAFKWREMAVDAISLVAFVALLIQALAIAPSGGAGETGEACQITATDSAGDLYILGAGDTFEEARQNQAPMPANWREYALIGCGNLGDESK